MKQTVFTVILDEQTSKMLEGLAKATDRSKGAVVRQLIRMANIPAEEKYFMPRELERFLAI